ncbi:MAG: hypothetical protein CO002_04230 [Candidatus Portnoybacteria bacterium CG_4_8_14_3_um_filter_44_10]|uniref:GGDEF domain-containing protein n=1 Tax=Candidatus Portnoybacteria bacterium CG_4_8_14_3_um_filter_44_10 TaxID=1974802 RepID=A0A2M7IEV5_9BACT|nr:MAG: hypothetical protein CO002_04230 [Candidatus Portnoybacteria bacterium CG_4_8_14_3_um_filter_44_10]
MNEGSPEKNNTVDELIIHLDGLKQQVEELSRKNESLKTENEIFKKEKAELEQLATKDKLTCLYNRRGIEEEIEKCVEAITNGREYREKRGLPQMQSVGILLLDIDKFKQVNDTNGHPAGDAVLKKVAAICAAQVRDFDRAGRWGGEEFVIILPQGDEGQTRMVAERIRQTIENTVIEFNGREIKVTISAGVAEYGVDTSETWEEVFKKVDRALYRAKNQGRNQVVGVKELQEQEQ